MNYFFKILILAFFFGNSFAAKAQVEEVGGETSAREQLFGSWDWVAKTRQPNRGGSERYTLKPQGEQIRITFDRAGRCNISKNGMTINATTYSLMEDDARIVFGKWDTPSEFHLDEGPFDFEANILWIRGEYNDKGSTWQLVKAGTASTYSTYTPPAQTARPTPTTAANPTPVSSSTTVTTYSSPTTTPAANRTPRKTTGGTKKKRR